MSAPGRDGPAHRDLRVALVALALLAAWEASGLDLAVTRTVADGGVFPWRHAWLTARVLHDGGRWLAGLGLLALLVDYLGAGRLAGSGRDAARARATGLAALGGALLALAVVPALKRASATSCPWDLAEFGGIARYVPHWDWSVADGGPGHCFPSGHAVAAFAFFAPYFAWRETRPAVARLWLVLALVAGLAFGAAQVLRGAHFVSHVAWSAWGCWALSAALSATLSAAARPARP